MVPSNTVGNSVTMEGLVSNGFIVLTDTVLTGRGSGASRDTVAVVTGGCGWQSGNIPRLLQAFHDIIKYGST